ncbi:hypothetical protein PCANC_25444 [Puccinia coronata f. sp. avenae]|uniref:Uncharacterized protein n=1 Tax=Puccinia coronata f. sp. avenae TaxID=200324 RepID=A0A2N5TMX4_9BASI|nr:hypothetical protein PCANC_25444 [Puccinia coronata f. sp. avenae]
MELHVLGSRWSRQLIMAALTTPCVVPTLPLLINAKAQTHQMTKEQHSTREFLHPYIAHLHLFQYHQYKLESYKHNFPSSAPSSSAASTPTNSSSSACSSLELFQPCYKLTALHPPRRIKLALLPRMIGTLRT